MIVVKRIVGGNLKIWGSAEESPAPLKSGHRGPNRGKDDCKGGKNCCKFECKKVGWVNLVLWAWMTC